MILHISKNPGKEKSLEISKYFQGVNWNSWNYGLFWRNLGCRPIMRSIYYDGWINICHIGPFFIGNAFHHKQWFKED